MAQKRFSVKFVALFMVKAWIVIAADIELGSGCRNIDEHSAYCKSSWQINDLM